jgi:hypothetical protein
VDWAELGDCVEPLQSNTTKLTCLENMEIICERARIICGIPIWHIEFFKSTNDTYGAVTEPTVALNISNILTFWVTKQFILLPFPFPDYLWHSINWRLLWVTKDVIKPKHVYEIKWFIYGFFNGLVSSSDYRASECRMISEYWIDKMCKVVFLT